MAHVREKFWEPALADFLRASFSFSPGAPRPLPGTPPRESRPSKLWDAGQGRRAVVWETGESPGGGYLPGAACPLRKRQEKWGLP